jgi:serine/threonine-protein kinase HipA
MYGGRKVGRAAMVNPYTCAFEYDGPWLADGFSISPFQLPLEKKVFVANREPFAGNFGVFEDSLPDGWGRLLVDRLLRKRGLNPAELSVLDRLAIVGSSGMGALEYKPAPAGSGFLDASGAEQDEAAAASLAELAKEAAAILNEKDSRRLEELARLGASSGGARPKVLIKIDGEDWIVKFRAAGDPKNIGKEEYRYSQAAKKAGLIMPETRLFEGKYFGIKRFDRTPSGGKIHMLSAAALLEASHRYPALDYTDILGAALELTRDYGEVEKMFRLMCFNVFAHNRDDHAKNFSFVYLEGAWRVSPAYDLVYAQGMGGEHATAIDGEGKNPCEKNIMSVAAKISLPLKKAEAVMEEVKNVCESMHIC